MLRCSSCRDDACALASLRINHRQNNVVDHSRDDLSDLACRTVKIAPFKGKHIVEHRARRLEADAVFYQVAYGFGGVPLEFVFIHNVRSTRSVVKSAPGLLVPE